MTAPFRDLRRSKRRLSRRRIAVQPLEDRRLLVATVDVSIADPTSVPESAAERLVYTLSRDETDDFLAVKVELSGTAEYDVDYTAREGSRDTVFFPDTAPASGPVTATASFFPGESTVEIIVTPLVDAVAELDETVVVTVVETEEFGPVNGAAARFVDGEDTQYFVVDDGNRLATVDVETGCVHLLGVVETAQTITDIAWTEDGDLIAISNDQLYEVLLDDASEGAIPSTFIAFHNILNANSLIDARDNDFGSETGDLFAVGLNGLAIQYIDLEKVDDTIVYQGTATVFNIAGALFDRGFFSDYIASGDLDYLGGDLILSARRAVDSFDSLIEIETPGESGTISNIPNPAQDSGEDFTQIFGFAFDGNDSYAFSGNTLLSVGQFNRNVSRVLELVGGEYMLGTSVTATGTIIGDPVAAPIVSLNTTLVDPPDLAKGPQPTSWMAQRSSLREIVIELGWPVESIPADSINLTNLGVLDSDVDVEIAIASGQIGLAANGTTVTITLDHGQMTDGRYQLDLTSAITTGDAFTWTGDATNQFFVLTGDFDGTGDVNILDFETYAYWFGTPTTVAPKYVDLDDSNAVNTGDFGPFSDRFGAIIDMPGAPTFDPDLADPAELESAHNTVMNRADVNGTGQVTPLDALNVLNRIARGIPTLTDWRFDVNQDGSVSPLDALFVINQIALGEGESAFSLPNDRALADLENLGALPSDLTEVHESVWRDLVAGNLF